jgi:hypothetical protein
MLIPRASNNERLLFLCQPVNPATSLPADDLHHYVIPQKLLLTNRYYFQQTSGIHALYPVEVPPLIADSFHVANGK